MNQMDELMLKRHSCRRYSPKKLPKGLLEHICHVAQRSPSAFNLQPYKIIIVYDEELIDKIRLIHSGFNLERAKNGIPIILVADLQPSLSLPQYKELCEKNNCLYLYEVTYFVKENWYQYYKKPLAYFSQYAVNLPGCKEASTYVEKNLGILCGVIDVLLQSHGIGSRIMEGFSDYKLNSLLNLPSRYSSNCVIWAGYEDQEPHNSLRYEPETVIFEDKFGQPFPSYDITKSK